MTRILCDTVLAGGPVVLTHGPGAFGPVSAQMAERERQLRQEIERGACERGYAEGAEAGRRQGEAAGREAATAELSGAAATLAQALEQLAAERGRILAELERGALGLALAVARKMVHAEAEATGAVAERVIAAAVQHTRDATAVRVRVNPADKARIEAAGDRAAIAELVGDPSISPGGCIVETDCGEVDATVETQWDALRSAIVAEAESVKCQVPSVKCQVPSVKCQVPSVKCPAGEGPPQEGMVE